MQEKIKADGLRGIKHQIVSNTADALNFIGEGLSYPIIVKPLESAATEGVSLCNNADEVEVAITKFLGATNVFGFVNNSMMIQEFLVGTEYAVDCISKDGKHLLVELWE